ncbi:MAG: hypothetical protein ACK42G_04470, partial [Candidatus Kapaibacteriota bacterium]
AFFLALPFRKQEGNKQKQQEKKTGKQSNLIEQYRFLHFLSYTHYIEKRTSSLLSFSFFFSSSMSLPSLPIVAGWLSSLQQMEDEQNYHEIETILLSEQSKEMEKMMIWLKWEMEQRKIERKESLAKS